jgi:hypothetical protein
VSVNPWVDGLTPMWVWVWVELWVPTGVPVPFSNADQGTDSTQNRVGTMHPSPSSYLQPDDTGDRNECPLTMPIMTPTNLMTLNLNPMMTNLTLTWNDEKHEAGTPWSGDNEHTSTHTISHGHWRQTTQHWPPALRATACRVDHGACWL